MDLLNWGCCGYDDRDIAVLAEALRENVSVTDIDLMVCVWMRRRYLLKN